MHSADYALTRCLSVRLSVRLSITRRYCVLTFIHILKLFLPSGSPIILVFQYQTGWQYSDGDPLTTASNAWRVWIQKLSYRKQIARQLRRQCVESIYRPKYYTVKLKSRLTVTQDHWKRNHWIDHTRLTISRVIWRWILSWPKNVGQRSLKIIESGTIWKLRYGFLFAFHRNYGRIFSHFGDIQRQRMTWPWNVGFGLFKVIENGAVR